MRLSVEVNMNRFADFFFPIARFMLSVGPGPMATGSSILLSVRQSCLGTLEEAGRVYRVGVVSSKEIQRCTFSPHFYFDFSNNLIGRIT